MMRLKHGLAIQPLLADSVFLFGVNCILLITLTVSRALLLLRNNELANNVSHTDLLDAFLIGSRFDLMTITYLSAPLVFAMLLPRGLHPRWLFVGWSTLTGSVLLFLGVLELDFYHEFHVRLNSIVFQYVNEDATTVAKMLWNGFPVLQYLSLWVFMCSLMWFGFRWLNRQTDCMVMKTQLIRNYRLRIPVFLLLAITSFFTARGTFRTGPPLRWGDAYHSNHLFANHLALNGAFSLLKAWQADGNNKANQHWLESMPQTEALQLTRALLAAPVDTLLAPQQSAVLRSYTPETIPANHSIQNIVVIMMESFSAEFIGALGHQYAITPEFDRLTRRGVLFDHFFSNGTHTHQGMFASITCFPNLPGHEFLMQQPQGAQQFSGLPDILSKRGFDNIYIYNGDFSWDNQQGFFRHQGITRFIGRNDYINPAFIDPTWGVSDQEMFNRAVTELDQLALKKKPFYAILQTLSNHTPFVVPEPLPIQAVTNQGAMNERMTAMKYSDWALGEFFRRIEYTDWYKHTLFAILGDHGFSTSNQVTDIDLARYHIPLLLVGPGIREQFGSTQSMVGTQVDLVPTLVARLDQPFTHACWGRDLLRLPDKDSGFGMIKSSGSDKTVALIKGNKILVRPDGGKDTLYEYSLYPQATAQRLEQTQPLLKKQLDGFIETAMYRLLNRQTSPQ